MDRISRDMSSIDAVSLFRLASAAAIVSIANSRKIFQPTYMEANNYLDL